MAIIKLVSGLWDFNMYFNGQCELLENIIRHNRFRQMCQNMNNLIATKKRTLLLAVK